MDVETTGEQRAKEYMPSRCSIKRPVSTDWQHILSKDFEFQQPIDAGDVGQAQRLHNGLSSGVLSTE